MSQLTQHSRCYQLGPRPAGCWWDCIPPSLRRRRRLCPTRKRSRSLWDRRPGRARQPRCPGCRLRSS